MVYRDLYSYRRRVRVVTLFLTVFSHYIVSACWASLQKFLKGKFDEYKQLICIMQRVHFKVLVDAFNCQQILVKVSFIIFDTVVKTKSSVV